MPKFAKHLHNWGETGTVKVKTVGKPKVADRGVQCMFIGYALNHDGDCYKMWDPKTGGVHETRDVIWLKRFFFSEPINEDEFATIPLDHENDPANEAGEGESKDGATDIEIWRL